MSSWLLLRRAFALRRAVLVAAPFGCVLAACGAGESPDLHSTFARIQIEEARIEHAEHDLVPSATCEARAGSCAVVCDAAENVCVLAAEVDDRDARVRCQRATSRCAACDPSAVCRSNP